MGDLKTLLLRALLALAPLSAWAMPSAPTDQAQVFATCLGRFSAEMEHEWLQGLPGETAREERRLFESLLEAVLPDAKQAGMSARKVLHMRIEAKHAQARLLQNAMFHNDPRHARYARISAENEIGLCRALVMG